MTSTKQPAVGGIYTPDTIVTTVVLQIAELVFAAAAAVPDSPSARGVMVVSAAIAGAAIVCLIVSACQIVFREEKRHDGDAVAADLAWKTDMEARGGRRSQWMTGMSVVAWAVVIAGLTLPKTAAIGIVPIHSVTAVLLAMIVIVDVPSFIRSVRFDLAKPKT